MINESTHDPSKPLIRPGVIEKESSINLLAGPFHEMKDYEEFNNNNFTNFKTKGFANSNFANYSLFNQNIFGPIEKQDNSQNPFINDLNSNKKDISFSKKPQIDCEFSNFVSNPNNALNFQNAFNLSQSHFANGIQEGYIFFNNPPILGEESRLIENEKNLKSLYSQNFGTHANDKGNFYSDSLFGPFGNKESSKKMLLDIGNLEEEPVYVNEKQYHRMMIRRIKKAKEMMALKNNRAQAILNEKNSKKKYKYESRHLHAAKRPRDSNGKFLRSQEKSDKNELNEDSFAKEGKVNRGREKRDSKKIRKTNTSKNIKIFNENSNGNEKEKINVSQDTKHEGPNEFFCDEPNLTLNSQEKNNQKVVSEIKPIRTFSEHLDELDEDKNMINLNLSFVKKEEDN